MRDIVASRLQQIRSEYLSMPGLSLTVPQARRLWGFEPEDCSALLNALVEARFLSETGRGTYVRRQEHLYAGPRPDARVRELAQRQVADDDRIAGYF